MTKLNIIRLQANLDEVRARIKASARRAGRSPEDVRLVVVTKYVPPEAIAALVSLGVGDIGENRPGLLLGFVKRGIVHCKSLGRR